MRYGAKYSRLVRFFLFLLIVFSVAGFILSGCSGIRAVSAMGGTNGREPDQGAVEYIYGIPMDKTAAVISDSVADIYSSPDVKSPRLTQALYNQPVTVLQQEQGWAKVTAIDGSTGWIKVKYIDNDISSLYGRTYTNKIIVTSREKSVTSTPSGGITQMEAPMGAEFHAFNTSGDAYEVFLPGNKTGWLRGSGIIRIGLDERVPVTNADDFAATALRFKGTSYLLNGLSSMGVDAAGLVYICARINGIDLPRSVAGQLATGTEIKPEDAQAGDLVFLSGVGEGESGTVTSVGICTGGGSFLYAGRKTGYVTVGDINQENSEGKVVAARRIFN